MKKLYSLLVALLVFCVASQVLFAGSNLSIRKLMNVGMQPVYITYDPASDNYHIFCYGYDKNWDGIEDDGDEKPSWWKIPASSLNDDSIEGEKVMDFAFASFDLAFKPWHYTKTSASTWLFIPTTTNVQWLNLTSDEVIDDKFAEVPSVAVSEDDGLLFLSQRDYVGDNKLIIFDTETKTILQEFITQKFVSHSMPFQTNDKKRLALIIEGSPTSQLEIYELQGNEYQIIKTLDNIGEFANDLAIYENLLAITMNGSFEIKLFDTETLEFTETIVIPSSDGGSPRQSEFSTDGKLLYVTDYDGKLYVCDIEEKSVIHTVEATAKQDEIYYDGNTLLTALPLQDWSANNQIAVYQNVSSVTDENQISLKMFPNPMKGRATIEFDTNKLGVNGLSIDIISMNGQKIKSIDNIEITNSTASTDIDLSDLNLVAGRYIAIINSSAGTEKIMFEITK